MGTVVTSGRGIVDAFRYVRPDFDLEVERRLREATGRGEWLEEIDLYPDAKAGLRPVLARCGPWGHLSANDADVRAPAAPVRPVPAPCARPLRRDRHRNLRVLAALASLPV